MTVDGCGHDNLVFLAEIDSMHDAPEPFLYVRAHIRCDDCNTLFSWRGLNSGAANALEPVTSADGYELRAPIVPRPGGVVGVLAMAGLEDKLKDGATSLP